MPAPASSGKPGRPKAIDAVARRRAILDAAHEAFVELGFAGTTIAFIAARARISKRSIYALFT
ncbi:MAG TPA: helix-turn-helix domain-containing protein, partial [Paenirhodobacter sp.]